MSNAPHLQLSAARKHLSDARLLAFFRAARTKHQPLAIKIINGELDKGKTLDAFFAEFGNVPVERGGFEVELKVKRITPRVYTVVYGLSGGHVGDGGEWRVVFSAGSKVLQLQEGPVWIA